MKKRICTMLAIVMCFAMLATACGNAETTESKTPAATQPQETIAVLEAPESAADAPVESAEVPQPAGYPGKTINLIIPVKAGAALDLNMRAMADRIDLGGADIVIQNVAGASQTIGIAQGAASPADGSTIVVCGPAGNLIQPHLIDLTYSPDSFSYIANPFGPVSSAIAVKADSEYQTLDDLIDAMKNGASLKYSTSTVGSVAHINSLYVWNTLGVSATHVAYNGTADAVNAVLSGEIDFCMMDHSVVIDHAEAETMRVLALSWKDSETDRFWPAELPSLEEDYGLTDIKNFGGFAMLAVPKGTPDDIVAWLCQEFEKFFTSAEWDEYLSGIGRAGYELYVGEEMDAQCRVMYDAFGDAIENYYPVE